MLSLDEQIRRMRKKLIREGFMPPLYDKYKADVRMFDEMAKTIANITNTMVERIEMSKTARRRSARMAARPA